MWRWRWDSRGGRCGSASAMAEVGKGEERGRDRQEVHEGVGAFIGRWVIVIFEKRESMELYGYSYKRMYTVRIRTVD